jgi:hypothetical protein
VSSRSVFALVGFTSLLLLDVGSTYLFLIAQAVSHESSIALDYLMIAAWLAVVISLIWGKGSIALRLLLAASPVLLVVGMLAYTTFVEGNY